MLPTKPTQTTITGLSGWGRYPRGDQVVERPEKACQLGLNEGPTLARGQGRSYGDASLNEVGHVILTERLNRFLEFDRETGILKAEAGATLGDVLEAMVPQGWFPPVTPGTKFSSLGGCVAADIHGKNHHHDGSFGEHVTELVIVDKAGERVTCSPTERPELFWATVGGMGLTGIIESVSFKLQPIETAYMRVKHRRAGNLEVTFNLMENEAYDDQYSVCWIDCMARGKRMGRSVLMTGHHAAKAEVPLMAHDPLRIKPGRVRNFKRDWPGFMLNKLAIRMFNARFYWREGRRGQFLCDYHAYFYPLDRIENWNRMYGKRGFVQYQFVVPVHRAKSGIGRVLEMVSKSRRASFLAVLKRFGPASEGMLSFPQEGYTLALDMPLSADLMDFLEGLDEVVLEHEGRVYLAKDARLPAGMFKAMYPRLDEFMNLKREIDPDNRFTSNLARRLEITP